MAEAENGRERLAERDGRQKRDGRERGWHRKRMAEKEAEGDDRPQNSRERMAERE